MHIFFGVSSKETDARPVVISCPVCRKPEVRAVARDLTSKLTLFHLVPVFVSKSTVVTCPCGASLLSSQKAAVLEGIDATFGARYIQVRVSPIARTLVLAALLPGCCRPSDWFGTVAAICSPAATGAGCDRWP